MWRQPEPPPKASRPRQTGRRPRPRTAAMGRRSVGQIRGFREEAGNRARGRGPRKPFCGLAST
eukprot:643046-Lingulodinium_polyedra.AAC.1